ncbi:uncharacterized protein B0H18DRAFT_279701 [Fomitopsis serialis]|uniref:uncharacterized protein n=1 Tax=Fomitopsis serialis TaxID=139415 RepID=UPI002007C11B|nr:uncharacterized protein B0H18DRAFT_279701 [Neoantrodia serialis]KAH9927569.1 hypothetical protein B0H18DRAFT_279701 [Neoantrodia serialis]
MVRGERLSVHDCLTPAQVIIHLHSAPARTYQTGADGGCKREHLQRQADVIEVCPIEPASAPSLRVHRRVAIGLSWLVFGHGFVLSACKDIGLHSRVCLALC